MISSPRMILVVTEVQHWGICRVGASLSQVQVCFDFIRHVCCAYFHHFCFLHCSFDDDSSVSSGDISDAIAEISTDDIQSGSSISYTSDNSSSNNPSYT